MGRMNIPLEILLQLGGGSNVAGSLAELATIKGRILAGDPTVTPEEQARIAAAAPYNLDAWDGYQYEREVIFGAAAAAGQNLVVLAGDTHNAWATNLTTAQGAAVGVEFATASVTSPGLEDFLNLDLNGALGLEQGLGLLIDDLQYANYYDRGFSIVTFTPEKAESEWLYVDTIESTNYAMLDMRAKKLKVDAWG